MHSPDLAQPTPHDTPRRPPRPPPAPWIAPWSDDPTLSLYAVAMGSRLPGLADRLAHHADESWCLLPGALPDPVRRAAPQLMLLRRGGALAGWLLGEAGPALAAAGLLLRSAAPPIALRQHLRGLLRAQRPDGRDIAFDWVDPAVLRALLPLFDAHGRAAFFGPVQALQMGGGGWLSAGETPPGSPVDFSAPLQLQPRQVSALGAVRLARDDALLADTLAAAFSTERQLLGERYPQWLAEGLRQGRDHRLDNAACLARYLACRLVLGAGFEDRPDHADARALLCAPGQPQQARMFQLCRHLRSRLPAAAPGLLRFDRGLAALDQALAPQGPQMERPCDIDAIDLRPASATPVQRLYRLQGNGPHRQWQRMAAPARTPVTRVAGAGTPGVSVTSSAVTLPPLLHWLAADDGDDNGGLWLRINAAHGCDAGLHPRLSLAGPPGTRHWTGAGTADVVLPLPAAEAPSEADGIAVETAARLSVLTVSTCGLRDTGPSTGDLQTRLAVYPDRQTLMRWQRVALPGAASQTPQVRCELECDGLPLDATHWQARLEDLDRQIADGWLRLAAAWQHQGGLDQPGMQVDATLMDGAASLSWGWAASAPDLAAPAYFRLAALLDLVACRLDLRLHGRLALAGSQSRLSLHCSLRHSLRLAFENLPGDAMPGPSTEVLQLRFSQAFVLAIEPVLVAGQAATVDALGLPTGGLVGSCGLRQSTDGPGLQWFCRLAIEPVSVAVLLQDPLLGLQRRTLPLLPALSLLDWRMS